VIALHSPDAHLETGLPKCPPEKSPALTRSLLTSAFSPVRFGEQVSRKTGMFRVFRGNGREDFSVVKTCWRSERDSLTAIASKS
jgi:hypothetical protein